MRLLKLFPPVVVVVLVVARNSAGSIDDTFFKTCFCRRCPGDCGRGHLLYMLSLCPIFALDRYKGHSINSISDIPRLMAS